MWSEEVYQKALIFAANAHKDQKVKGKNYPYIVHIINVSIEVISAIFKSKVKNPDLAKRYLQVKNLETRLGGKVKYRHIRREQNKHADKLSNIAMNKGEVDCG